MTALAEALLAAQRLALAAMQKAYLRGTIDADGLLERLDYIGLRDQTDVSQLLATLSVMHDLGAEPPTQDAAQSKAERMASDKQLGFIRDLADRAQTIAPDKPLTEKEASKVITQLQAGTYNADEWTAPF